MATYRESIGCGGSGAGFIGIVNLTAGTNYQLIVGAGGDSQGAKIGGGTRNGTNAQDSVLKRNSTALITAGGGSGGMAAYESCSGGTGGTITIADSVTVTKTSLKKNGLTGQSKRWTTDDGGYFTGTVSVWSGHTYGATAGASCSCGGGKILSPANSYHGYGQIKFLCPAVIIERNIAGTQVITIPISGSYEIHLVGGGGAGCYSTNYIDTNTSAGGGSGAYIHGTKYITAGTYTVTIGKGGRNQGTNNGNGEDGGNTIAFNETAGGGKHGNVTNLAGGKGGTVSTSLTRVVGKTGKTGTQTANGGASVYNGYGKGGNQNENGSAGYIKIVWTGT